ncbi:hypothetical protein G6F34_006388 [Rhizopus arrhizus]|nr:hypothetical protein G6F34_006388 [Rhizopus arrhizus]
MSNKPQPQPIQKLQRRQDESLLTGRKRSHSASSNDSPSVLFSNNFSDSGSSSMASTSSSNNQIKRKRSINHTDSSSSGDNSVNISSSSSTSSSTPQRLTAQRSVPAFLNKLYNMVDDESTNDLIRWSKDGTSFLVERHEDFARTVLPRFYKHNTFASFVRQLNMYDFHKIPHIQQGVMISESDHEIWEFSNPHFQRGRSDLLILVTRKKNKNRDTTDGDAPNINTLAEDLTLVKKHQATIGSQLMDLHRDNEILWQETLTSREKYHRHQEAIEKILLFLTAVFSTNDQLALVSGKFTSKHLSISLTLVIGSSEILPKALIEEAASLMGITISQDEVNKIKSSNAAIGPNALSNVLSSVLKLYSVNHPEQATDNDDISQLQPTAPLAAPPTIVPGSTIEELKTPSLADFSQTLNTATRSAQSITQDIDLLQMNIESLANNLGIDASQLDDDLDIQDNAMWNNNKMDPLIPDHKQQNIAAIINSSQSKFSLQNPPLGRPQRQQQPQIPRLNNNKPRMKAQERYRPYQQVKVDNTTDIYRQFISSMNHNDSFGPNYPNEYNTANRRPSATNYFVNADMMQPQPQPQQDDYSLMDLQNNYNTTDNNMPEPPFYNKR